MKTSETCGRVDVWTCGCGVEGRTVQTSIPPYVRTTRQCRIRALRRGLLPLLLLAALPGCAYYSFTGATIPTHLNSVAIPLAEDNSLSPLSALDETLTELLIDRFVRQTRLALETSEEEADAVLFATINRYTNAPTSVTGEERATRNRVTISVNVRYVDQTNDEELLQRSFSSFEDYDPTEGGLELEEEAAEAALRNIADDVFTAATSNW